MWNFKFKGVSIICLILMLFLIGCFWTGCAGTGTGPSNYTSEVYPDSFIVKVCEEHGWKPEAIADNMVDISIAGVGFEVYEKENAIDFINEFETILNTDVSYRNFIGFLIKYKAKLGVKDGVLQAGLIIISRRIQTFDSLELISPSDKKILLDLAAYWRDELKKVFAADDVFSEALSVVDPRHLGNMTEHDKRLLTGYLAMVRIN